MKMLKMQLIYSYIYDLVFASTKKSEHNPSLN